jgi:nitric oxide synthase-interacting protein
VACSEGPKADIFCRECALNDLVAQRKEIKRLEQEWEDRQIEKGEDERLAEDEEARRELERFERTAQGFETNGLLANGNGKKRKAGELEGVEVPEKHKLKTGSVKVDCAMSNYNITLV